MELLMSSRKARRAADVEPRTGTNYPDPFRAHVQGRLKRALGDLFGLDQFGVNLTELPPGAFSALRHWHSHEDELVYVLEGEVTLITDAGEEVLRPGDCVGFKAGTPDGHHLTNRSKGPVRYLEIGSRRLDVDVVVYPDDDLAVQPDGSGRRRMVHKDGTPY
jgi:uncharacterized cupin superfamily protein